MTDGSDTTANEASNELRWSTVLNWAKQGNPSPPQRIEKTEREWADQLTQEQFYVTRQKGTEPRFSSESCTVFKPGRYACLCCDTLLFDSTSKFDSGTGWPSFASPTTPGVIAYHSDGDHGMQRVEVTCNVCDAHLGHVFPDGPKPTGLRYCINGIALKEASS